MFNIIKYFLYFICLFVSDKDKKGKIRKYARSGESLYRIKRTAKVLGKNFDIYGKAKINAQTYIGDNVGIQTGFCIDGEGACYLGNNIAIGKECLIITSNHDYEGDMLPFNPRGIKKDVHIDDNVWIGSRVMILPGTHICEGAIIQGGSVVHGEIPKCAIAGGNPAKVFKYRNIKNYEELKKNNKTIRTVLYENKRNN